MSSLRKRIGIGIVCAAALALWSAGASAADVTWTNTAGGVWTGSNWDPAGPGTTDVALFTNQAGSAYTVTFGANATDKSIQVIDDKVIFDLAGYALTNNNTAINSYLGTNALVTFTSTGAPGIAYYSYGGYPNRLLIDGASTVVTVTNVNLTTVEGGINGKATVNVLGPNARFEMGLAGGGHITHLGGYLNVLDGGAAKVGWQIASYDGGYGNPATIVVSNNSSLVGGEHIGYGSSGNVKLYANSTWYTPYDLKVGANGQDFAPYVPFWTNMYGSVQLDNSTMYAQGATLGMGGLSGGYYLRHNGELILQNGSTAVFSNGNVLVNNFNSNLYGYVSTNRLILGNSTIKLGNATKSGAITNYGILKASGTITGQGPGNFTLLNGSINGTGGVFEVGSSIGKLTLERGNLELAPVSRTYFEFSETGLDQIVAADGSASVLGTNLFTLIGPAPVAGVKWGLGVYNFIIASNITYSPQYDNLISNLTAWGLTQNLDYRYGFVNIDGGLQALQLAFVPEPSTVLLLVGGGLVLWRFRRRT